MRELSYTCSYQIFELLIRLRTYLLNAYAKMQYYINTPCPPDVETEEKKQ